jgi:hypothetical protein
VNHILFDRCTDCTLEFDSTIGSLEVVHAKNVKIIAKGMAPAFQIDLSENVHFYFQSTAEGLTTAKFITSSCSEVYVIFGR